MTLLIYVLLQIHQYSSLIKIFTDITFMEKTHKDKQMLVQSN